MWVLGYYPGKDGDWGALQEDPNQSVSYPRSYTLLFKANGPIARTVGTSESKRGREGSVLSHPVVNALSIVRGYSVAHALPSCRASQPDPWSPRLESILGWKPP